MSLLPYAPPTLMTWQASLCLQNVSHTSHVYTVHLLSYKERDVTVGIDKGTNNFLAKYDAQDRHHTQLYNAPNDRCSYTTHSGALKCRKYSARCNSPYACLP